MEPRPPVTVPPAPGIPAPGIVHAVVRTDDNGASFLVRDGLTADDARRLCRDLAGRGHKQHYGVHAYAHGQRQAVLGRLGVCG
jgi:hypothetical protein